MLMDMTNNNYEDPVEMKSCGVKRALPSERAVHKCPQPECGRFFNRKYTLEEHVKTHTGERPHVCPVPSCGKRFTTSGNLSRHKRLHGYIEPLKCPVDGCICTFPSNNKLEKHMKFHFGSAVKVCTVTGCGKTFSTIGNLNRHIKHQHNSSDDGYESPATPKTMNSSSLSADQWSPSAVTDCVDNMENLWSVARITPTTSAFEFEGVGWNPELMDVLASILDDEDSEATQEVTSMIV